MFRQCLQLSLHYTLCYLHIYLESIQQLYLKAAALGDCQYSGKGSMNGKHNVVQLDRVETSGVTSEVFFLKTQHFYQLLYKRPILSKHSGVKTQNSLTLYWPNFFFTIILRIQHGANAILINTWASNVLRKPKPLMKGLGS